MFFIGFLLTLIIQVNSLRPKPSIFGLHVIGSKMYNSENKTVRLKGVNYSGTEFECIGSNGIFQSEGPVTNILTAFKYWNVNVVRLPLNENCWLGKNVKPSFGGKNYQDAILNFTDFLGENGIAVVLDLHWTATNDQLADEQRAMPNLENSVTFWREVALKFKSRSHVIFDIFNEPYPDRDSFKFFGSAWDCWKTGNCPLINYPVAGMDLLVRTIRETGSENICMISGLDYANDLSKWLDYRPNERNIMASWHSYNWNHCTDEKCWRKTISPIIKEGFNVVAGEFGENDCQTEYVEKLMDWMDDEQMHYIGWVFNPWNCEDGPALISNWNASPTKYGNAVFRRLWRE